MKIFADQTLRSPWARSAWLRLSDANWAAMHKLLGEITLTKLKEGVSWAVEPERIYISTSAPAAEIGLSYHRFPPALTRLLLGCLTSGASLRDLTTFLGRSYMGMAKRIIADLAAHDLIHVIDEPAHAQQLADLQDAELHERLGNQRSCDSKRAFLYQDWVIWSGPLAAAGSAISMARLAATRWVAYDISLAGGNLTLFTRNGGRPCPICLVLWFFGSQNLPMSYLSAALQGQPFSTRTRLCQRAKLMVEMQQNRDYAIAYFPTAPSAQVIVDTPAGPHPACRCTGRGLEELSKCPGGAYI